MCTPPPCTPSGPPWRTSICTPPPSLRPLRSALEDERVSSSNARRALDELQHSHTHLTSELAGLQQRSKSALDSQASLQVGKPQNPKTLNRANPAGEIILNP